MGHYFLDTQYHFLKRLDKSRILITIYSQDIGIEGNIQLIEGMCIMQGNLIQRVFLFEICTCVLPVLVF